MIKPTKCPAQIFESSLLCFSATLLSRQKIEAAAAVVRPLQEQLDRAVAEASSLREQTAVAVRSKEDASQRWMTWLAMQTARPLAPSAAVAQSSSAWRIMSPWRGKTAADRESAADSTERAALLARVETANTNMTQVATQLRKADNTVLEVSAFILGSG
eukprot:SAG31_NODE_453_length_15464_cov_37.074064_7_plen_159_part_00